MKYTVKNYLDEKVDNLKTSRVRSNDNLVFDRFERVETWRPGSIMIPWTAKMMQRIQKGKKVRSLHITDLNSVKNLVKIQNTSKSISTFNRVVNIHTFISLIRTYSGGDDMGVENDETNSVAVVLLSGKKLLSVDEDIWTSVDAQGRRWSKLSDLVQHKDNFRKRLENELLEIREKILKKFMKKYNIKVEWRDLAQLEDKKLKGKIIGEYHKQMAKFLKKNVEEIEASTNVQNSYSGYNELVLSNFKIMKIYTTRFPREIFSGGPWFSKPSPKQKDNMMNYSHVAPLEYVDPENDYSTLFKKVVKYIKVTG